MRVVDPASHAGLATRDAAADEALQLFDDHGPALYRFCRFVLGGHDEAEDVVQETFLKLLQHLQRAGDRSNLRSWLFTVAANGCRDRMRSRRRWVPWRVELDTRTVPAIDDSRDMQRARIVMRGLRGRDRLLLSLRAQGLSYREIASAAGIHETSVGRLLARAVEHCKRALAVRGR